MSPGLWWRVLRTLTMVCLTPLYLLSCLVPKRKHLWLFSAWMGQRYLDNPKYLFQEVLRNHPDIDAVWITKNRSLSKTLHAEGFPVAYAFSWRGLWLQIRSGVVVCTHDVRSDLVAAFVGRSTRRVQTWHGIPMKRIGLDDELHRESALKRGCMKRVLPFLEDRWDLVLAAGQADQAIYSTAFGLPVEKVFISGYPRNDEIQRPSKQNSQFEDKALKIIYMPTFRGAPGSEFRLLGDAGFDFEQMDVFLKTINANLFIKLHPVQRFAAADLDQIKRTERIKSITGDGDIYESIGRFDALITDYSGIYFDFLITGKPIILAPFDLEDYLKQDRSLYYDYADLCPDEPCRTWTEVQRQLRQVHPGQAPSQRYLALRERFHHYHDSGSCARAIQRIKTLVQESPGGSL